MSDQDAGQEPADPAEPVEHNVDAAGRSGSSGTDDRGKLGSEEFGQVLAVAVSFVAGEQFREVDGCGTQLQLH